MILPLYANLEKLDYTLNEAAMDLGSRPLQVFKDVTLPLSMPGIIAGALLVFIPASGELVIPSLVGRADSPMIGRVINDEFGLNRDWPMASTVSVALLVLLVVPIMIYNHMQARAERERAIMGKRSTFLVTCLVFGFAFFYIPILSMIVLLLQQVAARDGVGRILDVQWYGKLFKNTQVIDAALPVARDRPHERHLRHHPRHHGRHGARPLFAVPRPHAVFGTGLGAARHAGSHHRRFDAAALRLHAATDRLAGRARRHHRHHRPYDLLDVLCRRRGAVAPDLDGSLARGSGDGSRLEALPGAVRRDLADHRARR